MKSRTFLPILISVCLILTTCLACSPASGFRPAENPGTTITVFAAASLTEAFTEIKGLYEADHPQTTVLLNLAGSQQLAQQLAQGAPADVFASADKQQMQVAIQAGRVAQDAPTVFAGNHLVVVFPQSNPAGISRLQDLAKPALKLVLADQAVPVGHYSLEFLDKASQTPEFGEVFKSDVLKNVVSYEENVKAVLSKVLLAEADAGIVYASDVTPADAQKLGVLEIPTSLNVTASYFVAPVAGSSHPDQARAFVDFLLFTQIQDLLASYGFLPVQ
jgi:molybdate transport system substrate-binding protein